MINLGQIAVKEHQVPVVGILQFIDDNNQMKKVSYYNQTNISPLHHSEILLLKYLRDNSINPKDIKIYLSVEPCLMCNYAINEYQQQYNKEITVFYVANNNKYGANIINLEDRHYKCIKIQDKDLENQVIQQLQQFYSQKHEF